MISYFLFSIISLHYSEHLMAYLQSVIQTAVEETDGNFLINFPALPLV